jgi:hypothetical protein
MWHSPLKAPNQNGCANRPAQPGSALQALVPDFFINVVVDRINEWHMTPLATFSFSGK